MTTEQKIAERVTAELDIVDLESRFADMLDDCYSFKSVGGIFAHMQPSRVLREMDPTAFRCGVADMDYESENVTEINGELYDTDEVNAIREEIEAEEAAEAADNDGEAL